MKYFVEVFLLLSIAVTLSKARVTNPSLNFPRIITNDKNESKIVNGAEAGPTDFPFQLYLRAYKNRNERPDRWDFACGGSLISLLWGLTAAHCLVLPKGNPSAGRWDIMGKYNLIAGSLNRGVVGTNGQSRDILGENNAIPHPQYNPNAISYDIGVLRVTPAFTLTIYVAPVALPPYGYDISLEVGELADVSGFGLTSYGGSASNILLWTTLRIISRTDCAQQISNLGITFTIPLTAFCCDSIQSPPSSTCSGDSGGPMTLGDLIDRIVVGVVSFGSNCFNSPTGYSDVGQFRDWINIQTGL